MIHNKAIGSAVIAACTFIAVAGPCVAAQPDNPGAGVTQASEGLDASYHAAVASRGGLRDLADIPAMTREAWPELQAIGQAPEADRTGLFSLISDAARSLTAEQRGEIRSQLASSYFDQPKVLATLSDHAFCQLIDAAWETGVSSELIGDAIQARFGASGYSRIRAVEDIRVLVRALKYLTTDEAKQAKQHLVEYVWNDLLTDKAYLQQLDPWELFKLIQTTASQTTPERGRQWAEFYMDYLFTDGNQAPSVGPVELLTAGRSLDVARKTMEGQGYPEYADALAKAIAEGRYFGFRFRLDYRYLASPLGTDETRQAVRDVLVDDQGRVRLDAAKVLNWAYQRAGQLNDWQSYLETEIGGAEGDAKALWLLARSHCEEIKYDGSPMAGRRWVESALGFAESEGTQLTCAEWLMERFENTNDFDQGAEFLAGMEDKFESAGSKRMLAALAVQLGRQETANQIYNDRKKERGTRYRLTRRVQTLEDRIKEAQTNSRPQYEIDKLQDMLTQAKQELAALGR